MRTFFGIFLLQTILSSTECSVSLPYFDKTVLLNEDSVLLFSNDNFTILDLNTHRYTRLDCEQNDLTMIPAAADFLWIPYSTLQSDELLFEYDFGKFCLSSKGENFLFKIRINSDDKRINILRMYSSECNQYVIESKDSNCTLVVLPIRQSDLTLLNQYSSKFLIGHGDSYHYIIFDRKYEYVDRNRLLVISYKFTRHDQSMTVINEPSCLNVLKPFVSFKTIPTFPITDVKSIVPSSNGSIFIFFSSTPEFCVTSLKEHLQCDKKPLSQFLEKDSSYFWSYFDKKMTRNDYNSSVVMFIYFSVAIVLMILLKVWIDFSHE